MSASSPQLAVEAALRQAGDVGLADDDPDLDQAAEAFLGAAREEFWLEAARLARRRLAPAAVGETARDHVG